jgi:hypothetical protein
MYLLFLDESGTPPSREKAQGKFFVIGGVIIHHEHFNEVYNKFEELKKKHNISGEIKNSFFSMTNEKLVNSFLHLNEEGRNNLRKEIFSFIESDNKINLVTCVTDVEKAYSLEGINTPEDIYHYTYETVLAFFGYFLQKKSSNDYSLKVQKKLKNATYIKSYGMVFSDHRMGNQDVLLRKLHHVITDEIYSDNDNGGRWSYVIGSLHFIPSEMSPCLQLADIVAGTIYRAFQGNNNTLSESFLNCFNIPRDTQNNKHLNQYVESFIRCFIQAPSDIELD